MTNEKTLIVTTDIHKIAENLQSVKDVFTYYPKRYEEAKNELQTVENEIQDVLHVIELCKLDAISMTRKYNELRDLRRRRRQLKDELEVLEEVKRFTAYPKPNEKTINNAVGKIRTIIERQHNRKYTMKVRKDWQELLLRKEK